MKIVRCGALSGMFVVLLLLFGCTTNEPVQGETNKNPKKENSGTESQVEEVKPDGEGTDSTGPQAVESSGEQTTAENEILIASKTENTVPQSVKIVDELMSTLTLSQKIGQRFIGWIPGKIVDESTKALIREEYIGGFILYRGKNFDSPEECKVLTEELQSYAEKNNPAVKLFIAVDQEGGRVSAFYDRTMVRIPPAYYWGRYNDKRIANAIGYITGVELSALGCNMNLAPVLDIYETPDNTIIGDRSIGNDPDLVSALGLAYIQGLQDSGVIPVAKHFPGHGVTSVDSHSSLPVADVSLEDMMERELSPFQTAIDGGVEAIMTAHILYPQIDNVYPATLSPIIIQSLLRDRMGFEGVVMTDAFSMGALTKGYDTETSLRQCFSNGIDIILVNTRYDIQELKHTAEAFLNRGELGLHEIEKGTRRILMLKESKNLIIE